MLSTKASSYCSVTTARRTCSLAFQSGIFFSVCLFFSCVALYGGNRNFPCLHPSRTGSRRQISALFICTELHQENRSQSCAHFTRAQSHWKDLLDVLSFVSQQSHTEEIEMTYLFHHGALSLCWRFLFEASASLAFQR